MNCEAVKHKITIPMRMADTTKQWPSAGRKKCRRTIRRMDNAYWITLYGFLIFSASVGLATSWGQSDFEIRLEAKKYVEIGSTLLLRCENNVQPQILSKVTWMKNGFKIFEYINGRKPPYRNFTIPGATIDWKHSNAYQVALRNVDWDAAGFYLCEVSTDTPIFTKESNEAEVQVFSPQTGPPKILFSKRQFYIGENLVANCTTTRARPAPHITWLINGKEVDEKHIKTLLPLSAKTKYYTENDSHSAKSPPLNNAVEKGDLMPFLEGDIVDAPTHHLDESKDTSLRSKLHQIKNYRFMGISARQPHREMNEPADAFGGSHQRVVFDEDSLFHRKYLKHLRNRSGIKSLRHTSEGVRNANKPILASSQLVMEVSQLFADSNGRLEITCLATIPAQVGEGEQFADYKTYSVKVDVEQNEVTTTVPQPSKLGNMPSSSHSSGGSSSTSSCISNRALKSYLWQLHHLVYSLWAVRLMGY